MEKREKLHRSLMSWATEEMRFHTAAHVSANSFARLPNEKDFKQLCQKPLDDVWKYVLQHVRSVQAVKQIKGNIRLRQALGGPQAYKAQLKSDKVYDEDKERLNQERAQLAKELTSCLSDIQRLHKELEHVSSEVMRTELSYQKNFQNMRDLQRRECILELVCKNTEEKIAIYSEYAHRVKERTEAILRKDNKSGENYVAVGVKNKKGDLETESCREVRLTCEAVEGFVSKTVNGSVTDKTAMEKAQKDLWDKVSKTAGSWSISSIISALTTNTELAAKHLREETLELNIAKDAQDLNFSYGNKGSLQDLSSPPSIQKSVQQLLEASNLQHVMRWFKEQEHKNEEWKLTARLDDMMSEIHKHVHRVMGEHPRNVPLAKGYIDAVIQRAVEKSVPASLRIEANGLIDNIQKAKTERQELRLKHEKIQDFKKLVETKQCVIASLAKQNSGAPDRLEAQRRQVFNCIASRSMNSHVMEVRHLADDLKGSLLAELDKFSNVLLPCLLTVSMDSNTRLCVLDLSIAPSIYSLAYERLHTYADVCSALRFPEFKSPGSLFLHLLKVQDNIEDLKCTQQRRENSVQTAKGLAKTTDDVRAFVDLCQRVQEHDSAQCEKLLPSLKKRVEAVTAHSTELVNIKKQVTTWWEQPAQFITPWVVTEGMTFDQWLQRWKVAVSQVHKRMMEGKLPQKK